MAKVKVYVDRLNKSKSLDVRSISEIVEKLKLNLEEYIIVLNGELVSENVKIKDGDSLKFLSVVSGG